MGNDERFFVSHKTDDGRLESVADHLREVAEMAAEFARPFGAEGWAYAAGMAHDIGKYSQEFQNRILYGGPIVDHSTAGAYELYRMGAGTEAELLAYCVAGHHGGLPNGDSVDDCEGSSLQDRMKKVDEGRIPDYGAFSSDVAIKFPAPPDVDQVDYFTLSFLTRMVFSCLVDADYLCTERFMQGGSRLSLESDSLDVLLGRLEAKLDSFRPPKSELNRMRCSVLDACRAKASSKPGFYTLTVPTGGGKTYASLLFALTHALTEGHGMRRVIYGVPYTTIIEQNAAVFRDVLGDANVLEHHANFDFNDQTEWGQALRLAAENWDAPVVVTTNVQLFESLFANKPSRCRKLHNIAGSVIVLDEAQMLPTKQLLPCLRALVELVANYRCSVVFCTATQPSLGDLLARYDCQATEIAPDPQELARRLRRVTFQHEGALSDESLVERLSRQHQALCVVNSRKQARNLYELLDDGEASFHLTTLMHPVHRERVFGTIRSRLMKGEACRVVATSLVEAGVDLDFPVVYRAVAGVDSMIQAAGRCNREGLRPPGKSFAYVFEPEDDYALPSDIAQKAAIAQSVMCSLVDQTQDGSCDIGSLEAIEAYFGKLYQLREESLDANRVLRDLSEFLSLDDIPFKEAADHFRMIEEGSHPIIIPEREIEDDVDRLCSGKADRSVMRRLSRFTVGVYDFDRDSLRDYGAIYEVGEDLYLLRDEVRYSEKTGLDVRRREGEGLFL